MSRKKSKTVAKNTINECHLMESIESNRLSRPLNISHKEFTDKQKQFIRVALDKKTKIVFIPGPAGCAKTYISVYCGLELMNNQQVSEMVYIRSAVESSDSKLGFLPGAQDDKMAPYLEPFKDKLQEFLSPVDVRYLQGEERIYGIPVGFLRGASWEDKFVLIDEAQNLTEKEIITTITRIGPNTKVFICGDDMQSDIGNKSGFTKITKLFSDDASKEQGIRCFGFDEDDIVRSELVKFIVKKIKSLK